MASVIKFGGGGSSVVTYENWTPREVDIASVSGVELNGTMGHPKAVLDGNGKVYVAGEIYGTVYVYDSDGVQTSVSLSLSSGCGTPACATDGNGKVYIYVGDYTQHAVDVFDLDGTRTTTSLSTSVSYCTAGADGNGKVYMGSGICYYNFGVYSGTGMTSSMEVFDLDGTRTSVSLSTSRQFISTAIDGNGKLYFAGGATDTSRTAYSSVVDIFDLDGTRTTNQLAVACYSAGSATDGNGKVYIAGGKYGLINNGYWSEYTITDIVNIIDLDGTVTYNTLSRGVMGPAGVTDTKGRVYFGGGMGYESSAAVYTLNLDRFELDGTRFVVDSTLVSEDSLVMNNRGDDSYEIAGGVSDGNGKMYIFPGGAMNVITLQGTEYLDYPAGTKYSFNGETEQTVATPGESTVVKPLGNYGYIKVKQGTITNN